MIKRIFLTLLFLSALTQIQAQHPSFIQKPYWSVVWNQETEEDSKNPGWWEQYYMIKKNAEGKIPRLPFEKIREHELNSSLRSTPLFNIQEMGPKNMGGRTRAILIDHTNEANIFAGSVSGGLWHSTDSGTQWIAVNDEMTTLSISVLAQDYFNPQLIYAGTGEGWIGYVGNGVYRSVDGGATFHHLSSTDDPAFDFIYDLVTSPVDSNRVYVAANGSSGLFRSDNSGDSLRRIFASSSTISDIEITPSGGVWISVYWDGIYYSPSGDSGTFVKKSGGLPFPGNGRRIEFAIAPSDTTIMYAAVEKTSADGIKGIYRTEDAGATWHETENPGDDFLYYVSQSWYSMCIDIKPDDPDFVVFGVGDLMYTKDGGTVWWACTGIHVDHHVILFNPNKPDWLYVGNDGGVYRLRTDQMIYNNISLNEGYSTIQYYAGAYGPSGINAYGGTQDNGTHSCQAGSGEFFQVLGGDGAYCAISQQFPSIAYASWQNGNINITFEANSPSPNFNPILNELDGNNDGEIDEGAYFINPFDISLANGDYVAFVTLDRLWHSLDEGYYWTPAMNPVSELNASPYAIGISRDFSPTVYVGGSYGIFYRIDDAYGAIPGNEVNLSPSVPSSVTHEFIESITVHPLDKSTCYVSFGNFSNNPRVWKVTNATSSNPVWTSISGDLPQGLPVNYVDVDPAHPDDFFLAATDYGLYVTQDAGQHWQKINEIPNVLCLQVKVRQSDRRVFVYTHGRGMWTATLDSLNVGTEDHISSGLYAEVFPNPVGDVLRIKTSESKLTLSIRDINNREMMAPQMITSDASLDLSFLPSGVYMVEMRNENKVMVKKVVKQ